MGIIPIFSSMGTPKTLRCVWMTKCFYCFWRNIKNILLFLVPFLKLADFFTDNPVHAWDLDARTSGDQGKFYLSFMTNLWSYWINILISAEIIGECKKRYLEKNEKNHRALRSLDLVHVLNLAASGFFHFVNFLGTYRFLHKLVQTIDYDGHQFSFQSKLFTYANFNICYRHAMRKLLEIEFMTTFP